MGCWVDGFEFDRLHYQRQDDFTVGSQHSDASCCCLLHVSSISDVLSYADNIFAAIKYLNVFSSPHCRITPESPRWLLARNRKEDAVKLLRKMARGNSTEIPFEVLEEFRNSSDSEENENETFLDIVRCPVLLYRMLVSFIGW